MNVEFLATAHAELIDAIEYYNEQSEGLGFEFAAEVKRTIERIVQYPEVWTPLSRRTRRCRMSRFPYGIVYQIRAETVLIVAIMHLRQPPNSWKTRLRD